MALTRSSENAHKLAAEIAARIRTLPNLKTEVVRAVRREFSKRLSKATPRIVIDAAQRLMDSPAIEHRFVAYELVSKHPAAFASLGAKEIERFGRGIDSWGAVDMFACYLAGPAWRERQVPDQLIHSWAHSKNRWLRRAALVSTVPLNSKARGGSGDTSRTLEVCRALVADRDDMVVKAMSWALRELSKRDPKAVNLFLDGHQSVLAARVVREVRNKLSTGLKNPRLRNAGRVR
ncbi:MAG TPA: DNA alkylation repair protein [Blastocatellia bacterium]|nr:DNA alkylation repair protein [Blastocatellia bacterium]